MSLKFLKLLIYSVIGIAVVVGLTRVARVKTVSCTLAENPCPETIQQILNETALHKPLLFYDFSAAITQQLPTTLRLKKLEKKLPGELILELDQANIAYLLEEQSEGAIVIKPISENGLVLESPASYTQEYLKITIQSDDERLKLSTLNTNTPLDPELHTLFFSLATSSSKHHLKPNSVIFHSLEDIEVIVSSQLKAHLDATQPANQIQTLTLVAKELESSLASKAAEVDLRFRLPVLKPATP
jgi:hypothetical protein